MPTSRGATSIQKPVKTSCQLANSIIPLLMINLPRSQELMANCCDMPFGCCQLSTSTITTKSASWAVCQFVTRPSTFAVRFGPSAARHNPGRRYPNEKEAANYWKCFYWWHPSGLAKFSAQHLFSSFDWPQLSQNLSGRESRQIKGPRHTWPKWATVAHTESTYLQITGVFLTTKSSGRARRSCLRLRHPAWDLDSIPRTIWYKRFVPHAILKMTGVSRWDVHSR